MISLDTCPMWQTGQRSVVVLLVSSTVFGLVLAGCRTADRASEENEHRNQLVARLSDGDCTVRRNAAKTVEATADDQVIDLLTSAVKREKSDPFHACLAGEAFKALGRTKDTRAISFLVAELDDDDQVSNVADGLEAAGTPGIDALLSVLKGSNPHRRSSAATALSGIGGPAVPTLIAALKEPDPEVRRAAASALSTIHYYAHVNRQIDADSYSKSQYPNLRKIAAICLAAPSGDNALLEALKERDVAVIAGAHEFFIYQGVPGSEQSLIQALDKYGDKEMAQHFNCGNPRLDRAG